MSTQLNLHNTTHTFQGYTSINFPYSFSSFVLLFCIVQFFSAESAQPPDALPELIPKRHPSSLLSCPPHLTTSPLHLISLPYSNSLFHCFVSFSIPLLGPYRTFLSYLHLNLPLQTRFPPPPQFFSLPPTSPFHLGGTITRPRTKTLWIFCGHHTFLV